MNSSDLPSLALALAPVAGDRQERISATEGSPKSRRYLLEQRSDTKGLTWIKDFWNQSLSRADRKWNQRLS